MLRAPIPHPPLLLIVSVLVPWAVIGAIVVIALLFWRCDL